MLGGLRCCRKVAVRKVMCGFEGGGAQAGACSPWSLQTEGESSRAVVTGGAGGERRWCSDGGRG